MMSTPAPSSSVDPDGTPFFREAGTPGSPSVVCLHSNASSSSQWRALMDLLAPRYHVLAPDGRGAGRSPAWPAGRTGSLADEVAFLEPVFAKAREPFVLVGHSFGAAVALIAALRQPSRVRTVVVYEPTLFGLVDADRAPPNDADGIRRAVATAVAALARGDGDAAAEAFIDFWMGAGAWAATAEARRGPIAASVRAVQGWADALFGEPARLQAFAALDRPVLFMTGGRSPASSLAVARLLVPVLPQVQTAVFDDAGHMGPITHAPAVNARIEAFLRGL